MKTVLFSELAMHMGIAGLEIVSTWRTKEEVPAVMVRSENGCYNVYEDAACELTYSSDYPAKRSDGMIEFDLWTPS